MSELGPLIPQHQTCGDSTGKSERCHNLTLLRNLPEVPHVGAAVS